MSGEGSATNTSEERRQHERVPLNVLIQYRVESFEEFLCEYAMDLSEGGMFIRTDEVRELGAMVYLQFSLKDGTKLIEGLGRVVHISPKSSSDNPGMGLEFVSFDEESRAMIKAIVDARLAAAHE